MTSPRTTLIQYWLASTPFREALTRGLLNGFDSANGLLDEEIRAHLRGRALKTKPAYKPLAPYTEREWATLIDRCQTVIENARTAQQSMLRAAEHGTDPSIGGLTDQNLAWLLVRHGPQGRAPVTRLTGVKRHVVAQSNLGQVTRALFPTTDITFAYVLLFGAYTGIVPDGIADLGLPDIDWAGDTTVLLDYVKGRTGPQSLTLPRKAVGLLERWLEHSALLRRFVAEELRAMLWIRLSQNLSYAATGEGAAAAALLDREPRPHYRWCPDRAASQPHPHHLPELACPSRLDRTHHHRPQPQRPDKHLATSTAPRSSSASVFAGADVCDLAGLALTPGAPRPVFDQDLWVLDGLADAHRMMGAAEKRWDFTVIANPAWRRMAKELMLRLLAPVHEAVARLPHAHRNRLSPRTCRQHLNSLIKWLSWLEEHHVRSLSEVTQIHCDQFLQDAFVKHDPNGNPTGDANTPGSVAARVWVLQLVAIYGELFSTDRYQTGFTPWNGTPANTVAGHQRAHRSPHRLPDRHRGRQRHADQ